ncbi:M28 family peptidase [Myxococcota bacterium]|nr:M28 family peptidase [Myxococcota bacterium]MBU1432097.1 M28 family peptidase [Myxococcota bacterium]MBU1896774.1 M28 family peptidase [Myxococcota bacterium]
MGTPALALYLVSRAPGPRFKGKLPPASDAHLALAARLKAHVHMLAVDIGPRSERRPEALRRAAAYIQAELEAAGLAVTREVYQTQVEVANLVASRPGKDPNKILIIGAHYDTVDTTPGADDNASGVAALLEIARLVQAPLDVTVRYVAFVNEEPPHFAEETMGSLVHAKACKARGEDVRGMFSLEMLGYYDEMPGGQKYPPPLQMVYPDRGDYIAFVGNISSRQLLKEAIKQFRLKADFPSEMLMGTKHISGVDFSDHRNFWALDYPALMVTDTAFFRNRHYHRPTDTPDTLDYDRMSRVVLGLAESLEGLAKRL